MIGDDHLAKIRTHGLLRRISEYLFGGGVEIKNSALRVAYDHGIKRGAGDGFHAHARLYGFCTALHVLPVQIGKIEREEQKRHKQLRDRSGQLGQGDCDIIAAAVGIFSEVVEPRIGQHSHSWPYVPSQIAQLWQLGD